ncbi:hypothetical protein L1887_54495 [Cichorium endivia]|nr:hypothetical protein L1887_54495 [Cichorium endivia]
MARRPSVNDHLVARDPQARAVPHRWQSAVPPIDPTSVHAGPSRQTFDYHDRPDPGWKADELRNPRPPIPPYGWTADERDDQNARDGLLSATAVGVESNAPTAVSVRPGYEPAPPLHPSSAHEVHARRVSAEEWQYRQPTIPPTGSLPSAMSGAVRLDPTALVAPTTSPWPAPHTPSTTEADPPRARVACSFCRLRKLRCDGATPCRHCERRSIDCVYASAKGKTKTSSESSTSPQKGDGIAAAASSGARWHGSRRLNSPRCIPAIHKEKQASEANAIGAVARHLEFELGLRHAESVQSQQQHAWLGSCHDSEQRSTHTNGPASQWPGRLVRCLARHAGQVAIPFDQAGPASADALCPVQRRLFRSLARAHASWRHHGRSSPRARRSGALPRRARGLCLRYAPGPDRRRTHVGHARSQRGLTRARPAPLGDGGHLSADVDGTRSAADGVDGSGCEHPCADAAGREHGASDAGVHGGKRRAHTQAARDRVAARAAAAGQRAGLAAVLVAAAGVRVARVRGQVRIDRAALLDWHQPPLPQVHRQAGRGVRRHGAARVHPQDPAHGVLAAELAAQGPAAAVLSLAGPHASLGASVAPGRVAGGARAAEGDRRGGHAHRRDAGQGEGDPALARWTRECLCTPPPALGCGAAERAGSDAADVLPHARVGAAHHLAPVPTVESTRGLRRGEQRVGLVGGVGKRVDAAAAALPAAASDHRVLARHCAGDDRHHAARPGCACARPDVAGNDHLGCGCARKARRVRVRARRGLAHAPAGTRPGGCGAQHPQARPRRRRDQRRRGRRRRAPAR